MRECYLTVLAKRDRVDSKLLINKELLQNCNKTFGNFDKILGYFDEFSIPNFVLI
jgi:hypothetical protein